MKETILGFIAFIRRLPEAIEGAQDIEDLRDTYHALADFTLVKRDALSALYEVKKTRDQAIMILKREENLTKKQIGDVFEHAILFSVNGSNYVNCLEMDDLSFSLNDNYHDDRAFKTRTIEASELRLAIRFNAEDMKRKRPVDPRYYFQMVDNMAMNLAHGVIGRMFEPDHERERAEIMADPFSRVGQEFTEKIQGRAWAKRTLEFLKGWKS